MNAITIELSLKRRDYIWSTGYLRVAVQPVLDDENGDYASGVKQSARISFADGREKSQTSRECHESAVSDRVVEGQGSNIEDPVDTKERPDDTKEPAPVAADHLIAGKDFTFRVTILHAVNIPAEYSDVFCQVILFSFIWVLNLTLFIRLISLPGFSWYIILDMQTSLNLV